MSVGYHRRDAETGSKDHVGALATDPRQRQQFRHGRRHGTLTALNQSSTGRDQSPGLGPEKAYRPENAFDLARVGSGQGLWNRVSVQELPGEPVGHAIGALG